ncbi:MAG: hypothetical protein IPK72_10030 [Candidatus Eisenbacteria bacterium]|nr:hypothetical protein [Candidatus Eisenbacteria bacterium]
MHAGWADRTFATATRYAITPGQDIDLPDFVESGLRVSLVFDDPDALDRDHVRVKLTDENKLLLSEYSKSLEPNSPLGISNLAVGTYYLHIQPSLYGETPWLPEWYKGSRYLATATPIEVATEGSITDVVFSPQKGGWINFRLRYRGRLLPYAAAYVIEETEPSRRVGMTLFSADGAFAFRGLRSGRWKLGVVTYPPGEDAQLWWYPGTRNLVSAAPIEVIAGNPTDTLEWNLPE